jgi:hypothetical protein
MRGLPVGRYGDSLIFWRGVSAGPTPSRVRRTLPHRPVAISIANRFLDVQSPMRNVQCSSALLPPFRGHFVKLFEQRLETALRGIEEPPFVFGRPY